MSEIQIRLTDINDRASKAAVERDRQFLSLVAYIWIVAIGICIAAFSLPRADVAFHQQDLAQQESHNG
jgi:hypothetical protein